MELVEILSRHWSIDVGFISAAADSGSTPDLATDEQLNADRSVSIQLPSPLEKWIQNADRSVSIQLPSPLQCYSPYLLSKIYINSKKLILQSFFNFKHEKIIHIHNSFNKHILYRVLSTREAVVDF